MSDPTPSDPKQNGNGSSTQDDQSAADKAAQLPGKSE